MGVGLGLSKILTITSLPQLIPCFAVLSVWNLGAAYKAAQVIDEIYLNNQRTHLLFKDIKFEDKVDID